MENDLHWGRFLKRQRNIGQNGPLPITVTTIKVLQYSYEKDGEGSIKSLLALSEKATKAEEYHGAKGGFPPHFFLSSALVDRLRLKRHVVVVACLPWKLPWWKQAGDGQRPCPRPAAPAARVSLPFVRSLLSASCGNGPIDLQAFAHFL